MRRTTILKRISIWGATGSIGTQTLDVLGSAGDRFELDTLTAHNNAELVWKQSKKFRPNRVVLTGDVDRKVWGKRFQDIGVKLLWGKEGLLETAAGGNQDLVVNALVGAVGLEATLRAMEAGVSVALANKEVLVMAGDLVTQEAKNRGVSLLPIDSEHSAVFQCLQGEMPDTIKNILLTASGGPFFRRDATELDRVTVEDALAHPNWSMGRKVTIDSATLMNKALEVIEARWLFGIEPNRIQVVIHPQSIIHSMVEFIDGSIKAQLGVPDMRIPISYALNYPQRWTGNCNTMDFSQSWELSFLPPDTEKFPALRLAYEVLNMGGTAPAVLNAADEVAVGLFLSERIGFPQISKIVEEIIRRHDVTSSPDLEDILTADRWAREVIDKDILSKSRI